jgi:hypothetical protein
MSNAMPAAEQAPRRGGKATSRNRLLGACLFPGFDVALLWWLHGSLLDFHTLSWNAETVAWLAALVVVMGVESFVLVQLRQRRTAATWRTVTSALTLLLVMGLFWLLAAEVVYLWETIPSIPAD